MEAGRFLCMGIIVDPQTDDILLGIQDGCIHLHFAHRDALHQFLISVHLRQFFFVLLFQKFVHIGYIEVQIIHRYHFGAIIFQHTYSIFTAVTVC